MKIYLRKILNHDITHEISITKEIVKNFFENSSNFTMIGKITKKEYDVTINNATDPRFGGGMKSLIRDEGDCELNDILKIVKLSNNKYELSIIKTNDDQYKCLNILYNEYNEKRHMVFELPEIINKKDNLDEDLTLEDLAKMLKDACEKASENNSKTAAIHLFGIRYGKIIKEKGIPQNKLIELSGINSVYKDELSKGIKLGNYISFNKEKNEYYFEKDNLDSNISENRVKGASNFVYYGIPGCGKSYTVNKKYNLNRENKNNYKRIIFHPEYTYEDFVGQILPKVEGEKVKYEFEPGPFTCILRDALNSENKNYYLVIEELNRGNAPAIFGDIFQLLDRDKDGESEYFIDNKLISSYFDEIIKREPEKYSDLKNIDKIYLPSNLSIICTMNTSDQNVFVMDTAFKRRFEFIKIKNNIEECAFKDFYIPIKNIKCTWEEFVNGINNKIVESTSEITNAEDKQIGAYFISKNYLNKENEEFNEEKSRKFAEKVLMYLWEDVFKYNRQEVFSDINTLDKLIETFCGEEVNKILDCLEINYNN